MRINFAGSVEQFLRSQMFVTGYISLDVFLCQRKTDVCDIAYNQCLTLEGPHETDRAQISWSRTIWWTVLFVPRKTVSGLTILPPVIFCWHCDESWQHLKSSSREIMRRSMTKTYTKFWCKWSSWISANLGKLLFENICWMAQIWSQVVGVLSKPSVIIAG